MVNLRMPTRQLGQGVTVGTIDLCAEIAAVSKRIRKARNKAVRLSNIEHMRRLVEELARHENELIAKYEALNGH